LKPLIQKLPLAVETSFVAKTFRTPHFEVPWHQHIEYELILFTEGNGMSFIGNYVGAFRTGDVFFIGSNMPHTFQKQHKEIIASAVVVQFREDFWGTGLLQLPESGAVQQLLTLSMMGVKPEGGTKEQLAELIKALETAEAFSRISLLCQCLHLLATEEKKQTLSTRSMDTSNNKYRQRLDAVFQFTISHFQQPITLTEVAQIAHMSITAFCRYFKTSTKKSYIEFLNEIRIGYACKLLQDTDKTIVDICYESGFNTAVHFNKQFIKLKKMTPGKYRSRFLKEIS
jgi:AraC-like DNA-binding protein